VLFLMILAACMGGDDSQRIWIFEGSLELEGVNPIGITETEGALWLSDGDHNRLVSLDMAGNIKVEIDEISVALKSLTNISFFVETVKQLKLDINEELKQIDGGEAVIPLIKEMDKIDVKDVSKTSKQ